MKSTNMLERLNLVCSNAGPHVVRHLPLRRQSRGLRLSALAVETMKTGSRRSAILTDHPGMPKKITFRNTPDGGGCGRRCAIAGLRAACKSDLIDTALLLNLTVTTWWEKKMENIRSAGW